MGIIGLGASSRPFLPPIELGDDRFTRIYPYSAELPLIIGTAGTASTIASAPIYQLDTLVGVNRLRYHAEAALIAPWNAWNRRLEFAGACYVDNATHVSNAANEIGIGFGTLFSTFANYLNDGAAGYNAVNLRARPGGFWTVDYSVQGNLPGVFTSAVSTVPFATDTIVTVRVELVPATSLRAWLNGALVLEDLNSANLPDAGSSSGPNGFGAYVKSGPNALNRIQGRFIGGFIRGGYRA